MGNKFKRVNKFNCLIKLKITYTEGIRSIKNKDKERINNNRIRGIN
jgi:hypothetical protein